jgi:hypothetical protein
VYQISVYAELSLTSTSLPRASYVSHSPFVPHALESTEASLLNAFHVYDYAVSRDAVYEGRDH